MPSVEQFAHAIPGAGRDHTHIDVGRGHDGLEVDREPVGRTSASYPASGRLDIALIEVALQVIGNQDHHRSRPLAASAVVITRRIFILPVKIFADIMVCDGRFLLKDKSCGCGCKYYHSQGYVEVYIPFAYSNDIRQTLDLNNISFANRIRFNIKYS